MADGDEIPDRAIATALEFAVGTAAAGTTKRQPFPAGLRPFLKLTKLPSAKALRAVRRAVENDPAFMQTLAQKASAELVDEIGLLWLRRPDGWQQQLAELIDVQVDSGALDTVGELRRAEHRRHAAEQRALRATADLAALRDDLDRVAKLHAEAEAEVANLRRERDALRNAATAHQAEMRRATDRLTTAQARLETQRIDAATARQRANAAESLRDQVLADRAAGTGERPGDDNVRALAGAADVAADLSRQAQQARAMATELGRLAGRLESLEPVASTVPTRQSARRRRSTRKPVALPGGVYGSSADAARFLVRHAGIVVLVDGYNVAKLGWPLLALDEQRDRCIDICEDVARRFATKITIVFDGSTVHGATAPKRRLVRVTFSPEGVIADDVLRNEVDALPDSTPVLVVTNDQQVLTDVRARGANTLSSDQWLELACR